MVASSMAITVAGVIAGQSVPWRDQACRETTIDTGCRRRV
jgi:hypothetical protein